MSYDTQEESAWARQVVADGAARRARTYGEAALALIHNGPDDDETVGYIRERARRAAHEAGFYLEVTK